MVRRAHHSLLVPALVAATLSACSIGQKPQRPAWRTQAENACLAEKRVNPSDYIALAPEVDGPGICGLTRPFKVTALQGGAVSFNATATLDCSMVAELDAWLADTVQPAAQARFGQQVVQINSMGSYACRGMNNQRGAQLSNIPSAMRWTSAASCSPTAARSRSCATGARRRRRPAPS